MAAAAAVIIVLSAIAVAAGASIWIAVALAAAPWVLLLTRRAGGAFAVVAVVAIAFVLTLYVPMATAATGLPLLGTFVVVVALVGLAGVFLLYRGAFVLVRPERRSLALWIGSLAGPVVWFLVLLATNFRPGAARLSWVIRGDSANNLLYARQIIGANGIEFDPSSNPVPLPSSLLALTFLPGRPGSGAGLVEHDIGAFAQTWMLLIALTCLLFGLTAGASVRRERWILTAVVSAFASVVGLSWFVTGYPLEYGFLNAPLTLVVVLFAWIIFLAARRTPVLALAMMFVTATLVFATWGPLVVVPAALGVLLVIQNWRAVIGVRGWALAGLIVAFVQLVLYGALFTLPTLVSQGKALSAVGGIYPFAHVIFQVLVLLAAFLAVVLVRQIGVGVCVAVLTLCGVLAVGLGALLFTRRHEDSLWGYYQYKFEWLAAIVLLVIVIGLAGRLMSDPPRAWARAGAAALGMALTVAFLFSTSTSVGYEAQNPVRRILSGSFFDGSDGDRALQTIFALSEPGQRGILWNSGDPAESAIDSWVIQLAAGRIDNKSLRIFAYNLDKTKVDDLCSLAHQMGPGLTVYTADAGLEAQVAAACPDEGIAVTTAKPPTHP
ncbi:hypothetical protein [Leifsonia sp. LS-T14]|uniref:hypothetical protein n=1 Tax=unclassified Leifsonia TaxID=2663824 RepID=UPI0035A655B5